MHKVFIVLVLAREENNKKGKIEFSKTGKPFATFFGFASQFLTSRELRPIVAHSTYKGGKKMSLGFEDSMDVEEFLQSDDNIFPEDFNPDDLLSEPMFDDNQEVLDANIGGQSFEFPPEPISVSDNSSSSSFSTNNGSRLQQKKHQQQEAFLFQQQQQQQQMSPQQFPNSFQADQHQNSQQQLGSLQDVQTQHQAVTLRMQEVQNRIQDVQQKIQQFQSPMVNQAGLEATRCPPGRSISMPTRLIGSPHQGSVQFLMQQRQKAMQASMNGSMNNRMRGFGKQPINGSPVQSVTASVNMQSMVSVPPLTPVLRGVSGGVSHPNSLPRSPTPTNGMPLSPSMANPLNQMALAAAAARKRMSGGAQEGGKNPNVNEAMEKLCESMRRSAMSRSLVKQLSGRNVVRTNSSRSVQRSHSGKATFGQEEGSNHPVRKLSLNSKHRIHRDAITSNQAPQRRGVFRHKSHSAIIGTSRNKAPQMKLQLDDNTLGMI